MEIKSNTFGKLMKIREGTVFSNEYMFVKEFLQNAQRSRAKKLYITVTTDFIEFKDDGIGCKNPDSVFTLDKSEWIGIDEGFGIGFWSCLAFTKLELIKVTSRKWKAYVDVNNLFLNEDLTVKKEELEETVKGFKVKLECSPLFENEIDDVKDYIVEVAKYLNLDVYLNNQFIEKKDIFDNVNGDFVKEIDNRFFKAKLSIDESKYGDVEIFYDRRKVDYLYGIYYVSGVIEPKKGKLTLKEPDRTEYLRDSKYYDFEEVLRKEIKNMYMDLLKSNPCNDILTNYSKSIDEYIAVKEYSKFLVFDEKSIDILEKKSEIEDNHNSIKPPINIQREELSYIGIDTDREQLNSNQLQYKKLDCENSQSQISLDDFFNKESLEIDVNAGLDNDRLNSVSIMCCSEENEEVCYSEVIIDEEYEDYKKQVEFNKESFEINDYKVVQAPLNTLTPKNELKFMEYLDTESKSEDKNSFVNFIKKTKNLVWVLKEEADDYSDEISLAEYCKLRVYKAKNLLEENTLKEYGKLNIKELKDSLVETYETKNIGIKNKKEEAFIKLLMPICQKYGLHMNIFSIANLSCKTELKIDGKIVYKKNEKNSKTELYVNAVCSGNSILFDRNYLNLSRFSIKLGSFGSNEMSILMFVLKTVAHELAHFMYNTVDNTLYHYQMENEIYNEILNMYILNKDYVTEIIKKYA